MDRSGSYQKAELCLARVIAPKQASWLSNLLGYSVGEGRGEWKDGRIAGRFFFWARMRFLALAATGFGLLASSSCSLAPESAAPGATAATAVTTPGGVRRPATPNRARNVFVMLSGGVSPSSNNYSQYLQAKAVAGFFERNYSADSVWTFFGAGNVEGEKPVLGDVLHVSQRDGLMLNSWTAGSLAHNRPAKRDVILRALREEILPAVRDGGTLYLFVGDHGSQAARGDRESVINLWELTPDPKSEHGWRSDRTEELGVSELRKVLAEGLGRGRVIFCMTQCHSGGFHHLAVPREMEPNTNWFTAVPEWAAPKPEAASIVYPRAAGLTATDEANVAAGCDPDPDPDKWAGYERFIPEKLLGVDLFTLAPAGEGRMSFYDAHVEATLVDATIDKPYSTSEQYLERWADLIETKLAKEKNLTPQVKTQIAIYQRAVDGAAFTASDAAFRERQGLFARFTQRLTEQNTAVKDLLLNGSVRQLEGAVGGGRGRPASAPTNPPRTNAIPSNPSAPAPAPVQPTGRGGRGGRGGSPEVVKLWNESIRPAWKEAVLADKVADLPAGAREFEKHLLALEAKGKDFLFADARALPAEVYWNSGYASPATLDPKKAEAAVRWSAQRRAKILAWAKASENPAVRAAAEDVEKRQPGGSRRGLAATPNPSAPARLAADNSTRPLSRKTAVERVLFYRRTLAAWQFLLAVDERPALDRIRELTELERTPLPQKDT